MKTNPQNTGAPQAKDVSNNPAIVKALDYEAEIRRGNITTEKETPAPEKDTAAKHRL